MKFRYFVIIFFFILANCARTNIYKRHFPELELKRIEFAELPGWSKDNYLEALQSFTKSCKKLVVSTHHVYNWHHLCTQAEAIKNSTNENALLFFEYNFEPFKVYYKHQDKGLFTGYYEATLKASRKKYGPYIYPIYKKPKNLIKGTPNFARAAIEKGSLKNQKLEIFYVTDKIELFFLHIQGSARLELNDGSIARIGYAEQNGHKYSSIGQYLIKHYNIDKNKITANFIKNWLRTHPSLADKVMNSNPSYIFFEEKLSLNSNEGPIGAQNVPLTPERSLAVDVKYISLGLPLWLDTTYPVSNKPYQKLMIAQDKGGAIKGAIRGDVFFGHDKKALDLASAMKQKGSYYLLLPISK